MRPLGIVKADPVINDPLRLKAVLRFGQVNSLLLQGSPQAFDENVIQITSTSIRGGPYVGFGQRRDPVRASERAAVVGIHDFGRTVFVHGFFQSFNAEAGVHGVGQTP